MSIVHYIYITPTLRYEKGPSLPTLSSQSILASFEDIIRHHKEGLDEIDLTIARKDRERRKLVRKRTRMEREMEEMEGILGSVSDGGAGAGVLRDERDRLQIGLDEVDLAIARLDRERKVLRKKRKKLEVWAGYGA